MTVQRPRFAWYLVRGSHFFPCRHRACRKNVYWMKHPDTGKWMPFENAPRFERTEMRLVEGYREQVALVDLNESHWGTCPGAKSFHRKS